MGLRQVALNRWSYIATSNVERKIKKSLIETNKLIRYKFISYNTILYASYLWTRGSGRLDTAASYEVQKCILLHNLQRIRDDAKAVDDKISETKIMIGHRFRFHSTVRQKL